MSRNISKAAFVNKCIDYTYTNVQRTLHDYTKCNLSQNINQTSVFLIRGTDSYIRKLGNIFIALFIYSEYG